MSLEDARQTQKEVGPEKLVRITWDAEDDNIIRNDVMVKRGWSRHILMCQKLDIDGYRTAFPPIPIFQIPNTHML